MTYLPGIGAESGKGLNRRGGGAATGVERARLRDGTGNWDILRKIIEKKKKDLFILI